MQTRRSIGQILKVRPSRHNALKRATPYCTPPPPVDRRSFGSSSMHAGALLERAKFALEWFAVAQGVKTQEQRRLGGHFGPVRF